MTAARPRRPTAPPRVVIGVALVVAVGVALGVAPLPVVLGANRLVGLVTMTAGAWLVVGRAGVADLATGASAGAGAYLGGVLAGVAGVPVPLGVAVGIARRRDRVRGPAPPSRPGWVGRRVR